MIYRVCLYDPIEGPQRATYWFSRYEAKAKAQAEKADWIERFETEHGVEPTWEDAEGYSVTITIDEIPTPKGKRAVIALLNRWGRWSPEMDVEQA